MSELTFKINYINEQNRELEKYILSLENGLEVKINHGKNELYIKYNSTLISISRLVLEVKLFLHLYKTPSIISFNKHPKQNVEVTLISIDDVCCEYCVKTVVEDLILMDGIEIVETNYEEVNNSLNVSFGIKYDSSKFTENILKELIVKLLR